MNDSPVIVGRPIDFDAPILDFLRQPVVHQGKPLSLMTAALMALQYLAPGDDADVTLKARRFKLGIKIAGADGPIALAAEEIVELKGCVARLWNALIVGRVLELVDPESLK